MHTSKEFVGVHNCLCFLSKNLWVQDIKTESG